MSAPGDLIPPTLAEVLAACLALELLYAGADAAAAALAQATADAPRRPPQTADAADSRSGPDRPA
jgi:hypothetical protein